MLCGNTKFGGNKRHIEPAFLKIVADLNLRGEQLAIAFVGGDNRHSVSRLTDFVRQCGGEIIRLIPFGMPCPDAVTGKHLPQQRQFLPDNFRHLTASGFVTRQQLMTPAVTAVVLIKDGDRVCRLCMIQDLHQRLFTDQQAGLALHGVDPADQIHCIDNQ